MQEFDTTRVSTRRLMPPVFLCKRWQHEFSISQVWLVSSVHSQPFWGFRTKTGTGMG